MPESSSTLTLSYTVEAVMCSICRRDWYDDRCDHTPDDPDWGLTLVIQPEFNGTPLQRSEMSMKPGDDRWKMVTAEPKEQ